jgi:hypothetical protein
VPVPLAALMSLLSWTGQAVGVRPEISRGWAMVASEGVVTAQNNGDVLSGQSLGRVCISEQ